MSVSWSSILSDLEEASEDSGLNHYLDYEEKIEELKDYFEFENQNQRDKSISSSNTFIVKLDKSEEREIGDFDRDIVTPEVSGKRKRSSESLSVGI